MGYYNEGTITVREQDSPKLIDILNQIEFSGYKYNYEDCILKNGNGIVTIYPDEFQENMEDNLLDLLYVLENNMIPVEIDINFDYEEGKGRYTNEVGSWQLEILDAEAIAIRSASSRMLIAELKRRGIKV